MRIWRPKGSLLAQLLREAAADAGVTACVNQFGSVATLFFTQGPVRNWTDAAKCDTDAFARYFKGMLEEGYLIAPSQFEALFVSAAHTEDDIRAFAAAARRTLMTL